MEKAKAQLVLKLTTSEMEKMMSHPLPYQWMTILVSAMTELKVRTLMPKTGEKTNLYLLYGRYCMLRCAPRGGAH